VLVSQPSLNARSNLLVGQQCAAIGRGQTFFHFPDKPRVDKTLNRLSGQHFRVTSARGGYAAELGL
jgi:hypothetical protein